MWDWHWHWTLVWDLQSLITAPQTQIDIETLEWDLHSLTFKSWHHSNLQLGRAFAIPAKKSFFPIWCQSKGFYPGWKRVEKTRYANPNCTLLGQFRRNQTEGKSWDGCKDACLAHQKCTAFSYKRAEMQTQDSSYTCALRGCPFPIPVPTKTGTKQNFDTYYFQTQKGKWKNIQNACYCYVSQFVSWSKIWITTFVECAAQALEGTVNPNNTKAAAQKRARAQRAAETVTTIPTAKETSDAASTTARPRCLDLSSSLTAATKKVGCYFIKGSCKVEFERWKRKERGEKKALNEVLLGFCMATEGNVKIKRILSPLNIHRW